MPPQTVPSQRGEAGGKRARGGKVDVGKQYFPRHSGCISGNFNAPRTHCFDTKRPGSTIATQRIAEILKLVPDSVAPQPLRVNAFVRSVRRQKNKAFAAVGDGSTVKPLQAVLRPDQAQVLATGLAVHLRGHLVSSRNPTQQAAELQVEDVKILGGNDAETSPIQNKYQTLEFLRTVPHLRSRIPHNALLLRLRSDVICSLTRFFHQEGFIQTHPPIITSSDCEGAGEVFQVSEQYKNPADGGDQAQQFFGSPKYLTVSSQLHLEALAQSVGRVWTLSPTFRAEKSDTARHLNEFYMLEAEQFFAVKLDQIMSTVESLVRLVVSDLMDSSVGKELVTWHATQQQDEQRQHEPIDVMSRWKGLVDRERWPRITYHQAVHILQDATAKGEAHFNSVVNDTSGLQTEHERYIADIVGKGRAVFVTDYPKVIKPFYMAPSDDNTADLGSTETVACFDVLMPDICEVVGGSMREHRLDVLEQAMENKGLLGKSSRAGEASTGSDREVRQTNGARTAGLDWYLDLRRYGSAPHGGFGLGFDRLLAYLAGIRNVRDIVTFPRWHSRCDC